MILDTSGVLAALFPDQQDHENCARALKQAEDRLLLSPFVLAELDYLVTKLAGVSVELDLLAEVARGAYQIETFTPRDIESCKAIIEQFRDLRVGLADASIVVLARRFGDRDVLTLDEKHFRILPGPGGSPFRILPADG